MDHENLSCGELPLGMYASDRDVFDRVWKRVMPEERAGCPIVAVPCAPTMHTGSMPEAPAGTEAPAAPEEPQVPAARETPGAGELPAAPEMSDTIETPETPDAPDAPEAPQLPEDSAPPEVSDAPESAAPTGDDFPGQDAVPCLGSSSAGHADQLQEDILAELESWQLYRHLARRVTGSVARALSSLASDKHRAARRLAAAYFLISGVRYWPTDRLAVPRASSWLGALRRRFAAEQQMENRFRVQSLDTEDACLAELYRDLADECAAQAGMLRTLLETAL